MLHCVHNWVRAEESLFIMCDRGTRALPDGTWKSTTGGRWPSQTAEAAKSHHSLSAAQGPTPRAAPLPQMVSEHAALQQLQVKSSPDAFAHLQLCNPEKCPVFCAGTHAYEVCHNCGLKPNWKKSVAIESIEVWIIEFTRGLCRNYT